MRRERGLKKFKQNPKYVHQRSEGLTDRTNGGTRRLIREEPVGTTIIVGSLAMKHHFGAEFPRQPADWDIFSNMSWKDRVADTDRRIDKFWHPDLEKYFGRGVYRTATVDELYTIKVSHSPWELPNGSWRKHMSDIVFLKQHGAKIIQPLHDLLYRIWKDDHGPKRVNLNQESGAFFTDAVVRIYDHDSIHDTVAHYDRPLWMEVLKDGQDVAMDMDKVWALSFDDQVRLFREEIYATALERWMIPADYRFSPNVAYLWALRKTITSLTKGRSAQFLIENYDIFREMPLDFRGNPWYMTTHYANSHLLKKLESSDG